MVKLSEGTGVSANNGIICGVLVTVGDLARVVGDYNLRFFLFVFFFFTYSIMFNGVIRCLCVQMSGI